LSDDNKETFTVEIKTLTNTLLQMTVAQSSSDTMPSPLTYIPGEVSTPIPGVPARLPSNESFSVTLIPPSNFSKVNLRHFGFLLPR
jgi:hypothetical protein